MMMMMMMIIWRNHSSANDSAQSYKYIELNIIRRRKKFFSQRYYALFRITLISYEAANRASTIVCSFYDDDASTTAEKTLPYNRIQYIQCAK